MQIMLFTAAIVNLIVTKEWGTTIVLLVLTVFNALLSLRGEAKAAESVGGAGEDAQEHRPCPS